MDLSSTNLSYQRLLLKCFAPEDAIEVFEAVTPRVTRFMGFEPSPSLDAFEQIWQTWFPMMRLGTDGHFVIRTRSNLEFLGVAGLHDINSVEPKIGIWIKETAHRSGYGRETVAALISFAARELGKRSVLYPVAEQNHPSRRLAESLGGILVGRGILRKARGIEHPEVIYRIPAPNSLVGLSFG
jgi:RimJ/RimL family protein N-acetyltransferase